MSYADTFADAGTRILQKEYRQIKRIYVDLEYLQDLRFGAILTHLKSSDELKYVFSCLNRYNARYDEHTSLYFPNLHLNDKIIEADFKDAHTVAKIASVAPMTSMYYNFNTLVSMFVRSNKYVSEGDSTIKISIGVDNQFYPDRLLRLFKENIESRFGSKVSVSIEKCRRYSQGYEFFHSNDILFLYDFESFVNANPRMSTAFAGEGMFVDKTIFAIPQVNDKFNHLSDKDKERGIDKMRDQLNLYCDFEYAPSEILMFNENDEERR